MCNGEQVLDSTKTTENWICKQEWLYDSELKADLNEKHHDRYCPLPIHICPPPLQFREHKSRLKCFAFFIQSYCDSISKCVRVRNNFIYSLMSLTLASTEDISYKCELAYLLKWFLSLQIGSTETWTSHKVDTKSLSYIMAISYATYRKIIPDTLSSSHKQLTCMVVL